MQRCLTEFDPAAADCLEEDRAAFQALFDAPTLDGVRAPRRQLCVRRSAGPAGRGAPAARDGRERDVPIMSERILIVDDTPANIQMLMAILKKEGFQLSAATNGRQALEVIEKVAPDLVLMDVMMPDMDGYEACERIKAVDALAGPADHFPDREDRYRRHRARLRGRRRRLRGQALQRPRAAGARPHPPHPAAPAAGDGEQERGARPRAGSGAGDADRCPSPRRRCADGRQPRDPRAARIDCSLRRLTPNRCC